MERRRVIKSKRWGDRTALLKVIRIFSYSYFFFRFRVRLTTFVSAAGDEKKDTRQEKEETESIVPSFVYSSLRGWLVTTNDALKRTVRTVPDLANGNANWPAPPCLRSRIFVRE